MALEPDHLLLPDNAELLDDGYVLAVEAAVTGPGGVVAGEENVLVSPGGGEILTPARWPAP